MNYAPICLVALGLSCCSTKEPEAQAAKGTHAPGASGPGRSVPKEGQVPGGESSEGPKATKPTLTESIEYYDGPEKRKLWLSEDLVAEFDPSDAGRDAVLRADPGAKEVEQAQKGVRLWRVSARVTSQESADEFARDMGTATTRFSPVLHEGPAPGLPMRALPGGVVATFPADWDRPRIDAWLAGRGLKVESEVAPDANMFLVGTPPGLESVRIANELHETGKLVDAAPNFWQQATKR